MSGNAWVLGLFALSMPLLGCATDLGKSSPPANIAVLIERIGFPYFPNDLDKSCDQNQCSLTQSGPGLTQTIQFPVSSKIDKCIKFDEDNFGLNPAEATDLFVSKDKLYFILSSSNCNDFEITIEYEKAVVEELDLSAAFVNDSLGQFYLCSDGSLKDAECTGIIRKMINFSPNNHSIIILDWLKA